MIVADTSLVAYFVIHGAMTPAAEHVRKEILDRDTALRAFRRGIAMVEFEEIKSDPLAILNMSEDTGCSPYDLEFVWLAMELRVKLVTADQKVIRAYPGVAVHPSTY
ncbi:MAG TPA: type II toxin-antitoxin system VapC family toxin [Tepidisphaeraceae bacterium]|nr:type II toxin-antitoxin system VapC family toxin [Tepidisphaeraceae bacterium]